MTIKFLPTHRLSVYQGKPLSKSPTTSSILSRRASSTPPSLIELFQRIPIPPTAQVWTINQKMSKNLINIPLETINLEGILVHPEKARGLTVFAHGAGSFRKSPRNNFVAEELQNAGFATLLFDLLTEEEDQEYLNRFNIPLLTERLITVTKWLWDQPKIKDLPFGYFGASTGAASALEAAATFGDRIKAVVSRGGRPDLAAESLPRVTSPTLLIVGGNDDMVIELNKKADA